MQLGKLTKITGWQKLFIYIACGLLAIVLVERTFFSTIRAKIKSLSGQIRVEEANLKIGLEVQKRKENARKEFQAYSEFLSGTEHSDKELFTWFLREIEKLAKDAGLSILNLTPQNEAEKLKDHKKYKAELRAEVSLENFFNFLERLQDDKMLIKLDKFALTPKDEQAAVLKLDAIVSISIP